MTTDRTTKSRWLFALWQLTIVSLSLVLIFALAYWSLDALEWGGLQERNGKPVAGFLPFLYFSVETFFRIGYGTQTPVGLAWAIVTLEAMSHFLVEVVFIAHLATLGLHRLISLSARGASHICKNTSFDSRFLPLSSCPAVSGLLPPISSLAAFIEMLPIARALKTL